MIEILHAGSPQDIEVVRKLFLEYADSLGVDLCFQHFDEELATLPGEYAPAAGRLFIAASDGQPVGCVALRKIDIEACEMKRLYVKPVFRKMGLGKLLVERIISEAVTIGYKRMRLDTLPSMVSARALYERFGFKAIEPYRYNPVEGAVFMELDLEKVKIKICI